MCFPSFGFAEIHPFMEIWDDWGNFALCGGRQGAPRPLMCGLFLEKETQKLLEKKRKIMFLHVGNNKNIRTSSVIGIFDMDNATISAVTRKYLSVKQREKLLWSVSYDIPKSFILYEEEGEYKVCFSPLSVSSLKGRLNSAF